MKTSLGAILILLAGFVAGCATSSATRSPTSEDPAVIAISEIYGASRSVLYTNGIQKCALVTDADVVSSCQTLLLRFSHSENDAVRHAAACRLAHFGTMPALERSLHLARSEESPEARAELWGAIIELLQGPVRWPAPRTMVFSQDGNTTSTGGEEQVTQVLSAPDLRLVISCQPRPHDFIPPAGMEISVLQGAILSQYEKDEGSWIVQAVDKIPFVPFSARERTVTRTVREAIAEALEWCATGDKDILAAFHVLSADPDGAISGPAKDVVRALSGTERMLEE